MSAMSEDEPGRTTLTADEQLAALCALLLHRSPKASDAEVLAAARCFLRINGHE